jgi:hypothetical protein
MLVWLFRAYGSSNNVFKMSFCHFRSVGETGDGYNECISCICMNAGKTNTDLTNSLRGEGCIQGDLVTDVEVVGSPFW